LGDSFDRNAEGKNVCEGDALTENGDDDCFQFDNQPRNVTIQDGKPIHVAIEGFQSDTSDNYFGIPEFSVAAGVSLLDRDARIGTIEFDLQPPYYNIQNPIVISTKDIKGGEEEIDYDIIFTVQELPRPIPPQSYPLNIGTPRYSDAMGELYVTSATPLTMSTQSPENVGFQYRFHRESTPLPTFPSPYEFPVHWTSTDFQAGPRSVPIFINGFDGSDGQYILQYSAQTAGGLTESRHIMLLKLDNTPPVITIKQPESIQYAHSATLTLNYNISDTDSGVNRSSPTIDGADKLAGHDLQSGQAINLLTELPLGNHTFKIDATDNLQNAASSSVTFKIIVTPESIKEDVNQFLANGAIKNNSFANSLLAKLNASAKAKDCKTSGNIYQAFINEVQAQKDKGIDSNAADIMIADAKYLIDNCSQ
jgi:hypothetical protein